MSRPLCLENFDKCREILVSLAIGRQPGHNCPQSKGDLVLNLGGIGVCLTSAGTTARERQESRRPITGVLTTTGLPPKHILPCEATQEMRLRLTDGSR
jgi:hypothetical protein